VQKLIGLLANKYGTLHLPSLKELFLPFMYGLVAS